MTLHLANVGPVKIIIPNVVFVFSRKEMVLIVLSDVYRPTDRVQYIIPVNKLNLV